MVETTHAPVRDKEKSIFVDGVLFDIDIHWWKGWTKLELEDIDKEEGELPAIFKLGTKRILNPEAFKDFSVIESRARTLVDDLCFPFMISTVRFVPFATLPQLVEELTKLQKAFYAFVEQFVFYYDDNKLSFMNRYPKYALKLNKKYPDTMEIRGKFYFSWKLFEMSMPKEIKAEFLSDSERERLQKLFTESQDKVNSQLEGWVDRVGMAMRKEIGLVCKNMNDSLEKGKVIRESTLERTRETIKRLRSMNFIGDPQVEDMLSDLERNVPGNFDRDNALVMAPFKGTLQAIMAEAGDLTDITTSTGEYKRKFRL